MKTRLATSILLAVCTLTAAANPAPGEGSAIIAAMTGSAFARAPVATGHEGKTDETEIREGLSFTAGHTLRTGKDGFLCVVLSPGAVLCMDRNTEVGITALSERPDGLPTREQQLVKRIALEVKRGAIRFYGGQSSPNQKYQVSFKKAALTLDGGTFELIENRDGDWSLVVLMGRVEVEGGGAKQAVAEGNTLEVDFSEDAVRMEGRKMEAKDRAQLRDFNLCDEAFTLLDPLVFRPDRVDLEGIADLVGVAEGLTLIGDPTYWEDVSPTAIVKRPAPRSRQAGQGVVLAVGRLVPREEMWLWHERVGELKGVNYLPRTAVNPIEMWQPKTFSEEVIREELAWAKEAGFNALRVPLSFVAYNEDPEGFLKRTDRFLSIAAKEGFRTAFVLLDDTNRTGKDPQAGVQPDPLPGVYNSQWVPSVASALVVDRAKWPAIEAYIKGVVGKYRSDDRVLFWDVYQTPGNAGLWDKSLPLMEAAFQWVRAQKPKQPLTAGPWKDFTREMSIRMMELSDFISIQTFDDPKVLEATMHLLSRFNRPVVCTDWLKRQSGNTFEKMLPLFSENRIGWFSRGLVKGRSQLIYPEEQKWTKSEEPLWQQDVLLPDGKPYRDGEVQLIRGFQYRRK